MVKKKERDRTEYEKEILKKLLRQYERSRTFAGKNTVTQSFSLKPEKEFPEYADDADFAAFVELNQAAQNLQEKGLVRLDQLKNDVIRKIILERDRLDAAYRLLGITPKQEQNQELLALLWQYENKPVLGEYVKEQKKRIAENKKKVEYFNEDFAEYEKILRAAAYALENEEEQYQRDVSISLFQDSKELGRLATKVQGLLYDYGEFQEKESVFLECGIVSTPTYVSVKGKVMICLGGQWLDLSKIRGDLSFSTRTLEEITQISVPGKKVITIENLTTFHDFEAGETCCIYLGGFHNKGKRRFLQMIHAENPDTEYFHFGDIDAGGFYIYEHLKERSRLAFQLLFMDRQTLEEHRESWKGLTASDRRRLEKLLQNQQEGENGEPADGEDYREVLKFMLEHNCKLEQEALFAGAVTGTEYESVIDLVKKPN